MIISRAVRAGIPQAGAIEIGIPGKPETAFMAFGKRLEMRMCAADFTCHTLPEGLS